MPNDTHTNDTQAIKLSHFNADFDTKMFYFWLIWALDILTFGQSTYRY